LELTSAARADGDFAGLAARLEAARFQITIHF